MFLKTDPGWLLLRRSLRAQRGAVGRIVVWSAVGSLPALLSGLLVSAALDRGFLAGRTGVGMAYLGALALLFGVSALSTQRLYPWCAEVVESVRDDLVTTVADGALASEVGFGASGGESVSRVVEQVETVRNLLGALLRSLRQLVIPIAAAVIGLSVLSPYAAARPPVLLSLVLYVPVVRRLAACHLAVAVADEQLAERATAVFEGLRDVRALGAEGWATDSLASAASTSASASASAARADMARTLVLMVGAELPLLAVLGAAAVLVPSGRLSIGSTVGAVTYVTTTLAPALRTLVHTGGGWLVQLGVISGRIAKTASSGEIDAGGQQVDPPEAVANESRALEGLVQAADGAPNESGLPQGHQTRVGGERPLSLEARRLRFRYGPEAEDVVKDLDLVISSGEHLAIVGPSGGGKSTLALLLARTLTPTGGQVLLDGRPLPDWDDGELRRAVAVIPQQAYLFAGSVWENLTYLSPSSPLLTEVERAIAVFGLGETVQRLGGLAGTVPAGGHALSAGERQSVALARAWLSPASIVILDEATCHLDVAAEARAELAFRQRGGSLIVIAHRFGSALRAHRILVLDGSSWIEGTHAELLTISPRYRDLYGLSVALGMATV